MKWFGVDVGSVAKGDWLRPGRVFPWAFITAVYTITHGLMLFDRGLFWDDWVFWRQDPSVVAQAGKSMGSIWPWQINYLFYYSQAGITLNRVVAFASLLVVAYLVFDILRRLPGVGQSNALWAAVVFAVFPVYQARVAMVMVGYSICLMLFAVACWLLVRSRSHPAVWLRVVILVLFVASFQTASLLVFYYATVPALILLADSTEGRRFQAAVRRLVRHFDFLVVPLVFWAVRQTWFRPSGLYKNYNEVGAGSSAVLGETLHGMVNSVIFAVADKVPGVASRDVVHPGLRLFLIAAVAVGVLAFLALTRLPLERRESNSNLVDAGVILVAAAVFPYAAVGKVASNVGWDTRFQLLVPVGAALMFVGMAASRAGLSRHRQVAISILLAALVGVSSAAHVTSYIAYQRDWLKQEAMMEFFRRDPAIQQGRYIIIDDRAASWSPIPWNPYTYSGMAYDVFGDQKRFIYHFMPNARWWDYAQNRKYFLRTRFYKTGDYLGQGPDTVVTVREGKLDLAPIPTVLRLTMLDCFNRPALRREIGDALTFTVRKYRAMPLEPKKK